MVDMMAVTNGIVRQRATSEYAQRRHLLLITLRFPGTPLTMSVKAGPVGTVNADRVEAPVTLKAYLLCVFASFGGIFFG
jgi:hypothetical protein